MSANLQRFGMEKLSKVESLQEIIEEMTEADETGENPNPNCLSPSASGEVDGQSHPIMDNGVNIESTGRAF